MSAPSPPPDNSLQLQAMKDASAKEQRQYDEAQAQKKKEELAGLRTSARGAATGNVNNYFTSHGIDPNQYSSDISSRLDNILNGIGPDDPNPGQYFNNAGANIYSDLQTGQQAKYSNLANQTFGQNYGETRLPFTIDDPYLAGIEAEQRSNADSIIKNMLDRGVLTQTGYNAALSDLDRQDPTVKSKLTEFGTGVISGGQQKLNDIANKAKQNASTFQLGQTYDPGSYTTQADQIYNDFINSLGDQIRAKIGSANLFNTTGLAALGGAAQGAGNGTYNPAAAAGIKDDQTQNTNANNNNQKESIF